MPDTQRVEWLLGILLLSGVGFWVSLLFRPRALQSLITGWNWLEWRPLPHTLPRVFILGFLITFLLQILLGLWLMPRMDTIPVGIVLLLSIVTFQGFFSLLLYGVLHRSGVDVLKSPGWDRPWQWEDSVWGLMTYAMCLPWVLLATLFTQALFRIFNWELQLQPMVEELAKVEGWGNWITLFLLVGFIGPLLEEFIFRGVLFPWLVQRWGRTAGLLVQAFVFALIHQHSGSLLPLFVLSLILGLAYVYTRRLMTCVWAHALFNCMTLLLTLSGAVPQ